MLYDFSEVKSFENKIPAIYSYCYSKLRSEDQETEQIFIGLLIEMVLCALQSSRLTKALNHCNFILILGGRL